MTTPILETERIILRPLKAADAGTIFQNWTSDPEVARFMRWDIHQSVRETQEWLTAEEENIPKDDCYTWGFIFKANGELFGSGGLTYREDKKTFELGYNIMKAYWGQGLTTEAARAILDFADARLKAKSFYACHDKNNPASGRVLEKLGFVYRGDGHYTSFNGTRRFEAREYSLER